MFIVILFMFLGISAGYFIRKKAQTKRLGKLMMSCQPRMITWLIWLLLFLLGVEVGSNQHIISALPTLGVEAFVLALAASLGCCLLAFGLWKFVK